MGYVKDKYDVNLTQSIWEDCINSDSDTYYTYSLTPICITGFTDTSSSCEEEESYINYHNFQSITGVDFTVRDGEGTPEVFSCMKGVSMTDVQFIGHTVSVLGDGVSLSGLTFTRGGCIQMTEEDTMAKGVHALQDFGTVEITKVAGGTAAVVGVTVGRNMNLLSVQSGGVVSGVIVSGNLTSACVDSGAVVSGVTAGLLGAVSNDPNQFGEATVMNVVSSGTAKEISLGYGGTVNVSSGGSMIDLKLGTLAVGGIDKDDKEWYVNRGGNLNVDHGFVSGAEVRPSYISGDPASGCVDGAVSVTHGGRIENLSGFATLTIADGGTVVSAKDASPGATIRMETGGVLSNCEVDSGMTVEVLGGNVTLGGAMALGGAVRTATAENPSGWAVAAGALLVTFDLTGHTGSETAMIDNLANLQNANLVGITVGEGQKVGNYVLAKGSDGFTGTLTVTIGEDQECLLKVGDSVAISSDIAFALANDAGNGLVFSVISILPEVTGIVATVDGEPLGDDQWTNKPITLHAQVNEFTESVWYRNAAEAGSWVEFDNETGVTISEYSNLEFKADNGKGGESDPFAFTVNIDKEKPTISITQDTTEPAESVTVTAVFADNVKVASKQFKIGDVAWSDYTDGVTVTENTTVSFRAVDTAGNEITSNHEVKNIKTAEPEIFTGILENETKSIVAGGTATNVMVNHNGVLNISDGGIASNNTVNEGGSMTVSSGGTATETAVNEGGSMCVSSCGLASNTTVNAGGIAVISSCGTALKTTLADGGFMGVEKDGLADGVEVGDGAILNVVFGGVANNVQFNKWAYGWVKAGGSASGVTINEAYVSGEGTFLDTQLNGGQLTVSGGGVVSRFTNSSSVLSMTDGTNLTSAMFTGRNASGDLHGVAITSMTVESGARVSLVGGTAEDAIVKQEAVFNFSAGAVVNRLTVSGASALIDSGELHTATITDSYNADYDSTTAGHLALCGGKIESATLSGFAYLVLESDYGAGVASDTALIGTDNEEKVPRFYVKSGCTANNTKVGSNCMMSIDEATAKGIDVASGGSVLMYYGVNVTDLVCSEGGYMRFDLMKGASIAGKSAGVDFSVKDGALTGLTTLNNIFINVTTEGNLNAVSIQSGASVTVNSGCSIGSPDPTSCTSVGRGGTLIVGNYGTALNVKEDGGYVKVDSMATVTFLPTEFNNLVLTSDMRATLHSGTANNTVISGMENVSSATFFVMEGGSAYDTNVKYNGHLVVSSGGTAVRTQIEGGGGCTVNSGGSASRTTVNADCGFMVYGVATDTTVNGGHLNVGYNGAASGGTVNDGYFLVNYGGSAFDIALNGGGEEHATVNYGGSAVRTVLNAGAVLSACEGAYLSGTIVNNGGELRILGNNATVVGTTVAGGRLEIASGGTLKGDVTFADGGQIGFDMSYLNPGTHIMVENLADIHGNPDYRIACIPDSMSFGSYTIASGATGFDGTMSVVDATLGTTLGTLTVGSSLAAWKDGDMDVYCTLTVENDKLVLTVGDTPLLRDDGPDDGWNRDPYDKKAKTLDEAAVLEFNKNSLKAGVTEVLLDRKDSVNVDGRHNFVGKGEDEEGAVLVDEYDFAQITLDHAAKMSFRLESTDKAKFTVYSLVETGTNSEGQKTYKRKSLQTSTLKLDKTSGLYMIDTKSLLLDRTKDGMTYYISVQSTNANAKKNPGSAFYNISVNYDEVKGVAQTHYYSDGDDNANDWLCDKGARNLSVTGGAAVNVYFLTKNVQIDVNALSHDHVDLKGETTVFKNFVGFGDAADYRRITLNSPASLSFSVTATDKAKVVICRLDYNPSKEKYTMKALQTTALKLDKETGLYRIDTAACKLPANEPDGTSGEYYICVQSSNAKKGGNAYYNVELNKKNSTFYVDADDGANGWLYNKKEDKEHYNGSLHANDVGTGSSPLSLEVVNTDIMINVDGENQSYHNFVGFGDEYDYAEIVVSSAGTCTFTVDAYGTANSSSKFSVYSLTWNEKKSVWTQKTLTTQTVKIVKSADHVGGVSTKEVNFKTASDAVTRYFISMQSAGAKNGAEVFYNVSAEFTPADTGIADVLAMPETDSLALTDALSFGGYDADALAGVSAASLAELDGVSAWQNGGLLV